MLHTTFRLCREAGACPEGYRKLARYLGGVGKYGRDTPIPISEIVLSNGILDAAWALHCTIEPAQRLMLEFLCLCAQHALKDFENCYRGDDRPRRAITAARLCLADSTSANRDAACVSARAANSTYSRIIRDIYRTMSNRYNYALAAAEVAVDTAEFAACAHSHPLVAAAKLYHSLYIYANNCHETDWQTYILLKLLEAT